MDKTLFLSLCHSAGAMPSGSWLNTFTVMLTCRIVSAHRLGAFTALAMLLLALQACQLGVDSQIDGTVVAVHDGDSVTLLTENQRKVNIRLAEIDAPELRQTYGQRSRQELSELLGGQVVRAIVTTIDKYHRTVARLYAGRTDINLEMVRRGGAWVYRQYSDDPLLIAADADARRAKVGLWGQPGAPQPPWDWRRFEREARMGAAASRPLEPVSETHADWNCDTEPRCSDLPSCAAARYFLTVCGSGALDGDGDGIPCESLCR